MAEPPGHSSKGKKKKTLSGEEFPNEVRSQMKEFQDLFNHLKSTLKPLTENYAELEAKLKDNPLDSARVDLATVYVANSLYWVYLITKGEDPKNHDVRRELGRLKASMARLRELQNKADLMNQRTMTVDTAAASRLVKNALWTPGGENIERMDDDEPSGHKKKKLRTQ